MAIKVFCDRCEIEIVDANKAQTQADAVTFTRFNHDRLGGSLAFQERDGEKGLTLTRHMTFTIMTGTDSSANTGHYCKHCVIDAVKSLDDRAPDNGGGSVTVLNIHQEALAKDHSNIPLILKDVVTVFDHFRFVAPFNAVIVGFAADKKTVRVKPLIHASYPGSDSEVWVFAEQIKLLHGERMGS